MSFRTFLIALSVALLGWAGLAAQQRYATRLALAEQSAKAARLEMAAAVLRSVQDLAYASNAEAIARQAVDYAEATSLRADSAEAALEEFRAEYDALAANADSADVPLVHAANAALEAAGTVIRNQDATIVALRVANVALVSALDTATASVTRLQHAGVSLVRADAALAASTHKSFLARLLPRPGLGAAVGFDVGGRPRVVTGLTLGWSF